MARTIFAIVIVAALVAGAFAAGYRNSDSDNNNRNYNNNNNNQNDRSEDQTRREHNRQSQQEIQKCTCSQQRQYFSEVKNILRQCHEQCVQQQNQPQTQWDNEQEQQQALRTLRQCSTNQEYQRQQEEAIDCVDRQLEQQQQSCNNQQSQNNNGEQQIRNQDSSKKVADVFERASNKVRQQIEEAYEQQQNGRDQKVGRALANQVYHCTQTCTVQKQRQMDNAQKFGCELQIDNEQLKQTVGECHQKHTRRALEAVTQCAAAKGQQGAEELQREIRQKQFDTEKLLRQQY